MAAESSDTVLAVAPAGAAPIAHGWVYLKLVLVALCWGGTFIAGRVLAPAVPHVIAASGRFLVASAALVLLCRHVEGRIPRLDRRQLLVTFLLGASGVFAYNLLFFGALELLPAGRTALIVAMNPIVTGVALALMFREHLSFVRWLGIVVAFAGVAVVVTRGDLSAAWSQAAGRGELLMFGGVLAWSAYTVIGRIALQGLSPLAATTWASLWGTLLLIVPGAFALPQLRVEALSWQTLVAIAYLGIFGTVLGFVWYYQGVVALGPARTAVFTNFVPVFGVLLAALLLGEPVLSSMVIGGVLVMAGVTMTNRRTRV